MRLFKGEEIVQPTRNSGTTVIHKSRSDSLPDIDLDFNPFKKDKIMEKVREYFGEDNVMNTATYKTETTKSAILDVARGLGIDVSEAQAIAGMVPMTRGKVHTLKQCLKGDEDQGYEIVPGFQEELDKHPGLQEGVEKIEGIVCGRGVHASSVYIFNNGYLAQNSFMRAPNGTPITAFDMHQSDEMGGLKMDFLFTEAESKISTCIDLLLKDGLMEWKGSLYETYKYYLHPDNLIRDDKEMWSLVAENKIPDLFQFDTQVGLECAKKIKPMDINQLTLANSVMRLMGDDSGERPIDRFVRFKDNINLWYEEMEETGLTKEEQQILKEELDKSYGCSIEQETVMKLVMNPKIFNGTFKDANRFRKAIAKKKVKEIEKLTEEFKIKCKENGCRDVFIKYVWDKCFVPQLG